MKFSVKNTKTSYMWISKVFHSTWARLWIKLPRKIRNIPSQHLFKLLSFKYLLIFLIPHWKSRSGSFFKPLYVSLRETVLLFRLLQYYCFTLLVPNVPFLSPRLLHNIPTKILLQIKNNIVFYYYVFFKFTLIVWRKSVHKYCYKTFCG